MIQIHLSNQKFKPSINLVWSNFKLLPHMYINFFPKSYQKLWSNRTFMFEHVSQWLFSQVNLIWSSNLYLNQMKSFPNGDCSNLPPLKEAKIVQSSSLKYVMVFIFTLWLFLVLLLVPHCKFQSNHSCPVK